MLYETKMLEVDSLMLDSKNPRLPEGEDLSSQDDLLGYVANEYDAITIAHSIAMYGYFPSEALIAIRCEERDDSESERYIVVEGNRRLAALILLSDASKREEIDLDDDDEWNKIAEETDSLDQEIPVVIVPNRLEVAPLLGYRHISGIEPWDPWAKARYVADLIESTESDFDSIAEQVGESKTRVAAIFRNYKVIRFAQETSIPTFGAEDKFGVFERAMQTGGLRTHIGAPSDSQVSPTSSMVAEDKTEELKEMIGWLFGTNRVISDSRKISRLGRVVSSEHGLAALRETRDFEDAFLASGGILERLLNKLRSASNKLETAESDIEGYREEAEVDALLNGCLAAINTLMDWEDGDSAETSNNAN